MIRRRLPALAFAAVLWPLAALGQTAQQVDKIAEQIKSQAIFCEGTYALCIKAPCVPIVTLDRLGNYYVDHAACSCEVETGWSMGPGQCADRGPVHQNGQTFMISTYSSRFNAMNGSLNNTLSCSDPRTVWAWCYGAPCVVDDRDPSKATCNCPLEKGPMQTLGGGCNSGSCQYIYSAATPAGDNFANKHFAEYMQARGYPHTPPAEMCVAVVEPKKSR